MLSGFDTVRYIHRALYSTYCRLPERTSVHAEKYDIAVVSYTMTMAGGGHPDNFMCASSCKAVASSVDMDGVKIISRHRSKSELDCSSRASSSEGYERQDGTRSSTFLHTLKERVQGVLNSQEASLQRISNFGPVCKPALSMVPYQEHSSNNHQSLRNSPVLSASSSHQPLSQELQMLPLHHTGQLPERLDITGSNTGGKIASFDDFYSIDWIPKEFFLKFRQQVEGFQLGTNFEFDGLQVNDCNTKLVFKPLRLDRKWKFICEPKIGDVRLLTKKIPVGPMMNLQVGIGHDWHTGSIGWKWKVTSTFGANGHTKIRHKTRLSVVPGFDLRVGWNAEYLLPDLHGALGTGEPTIGLNVGHLYASVERLEAIYTLVT